MWRGAVGAPDPLQLGGHQEQRDGGRMKDVLSSLRRRSASPEVGGGGVGEEQPPHLRFLSFRGLMCSSFYSRAEVSGISRNRRRLPGCSFALVQSQPPTHGSRFRRPRSRQRPRPRAKKAGFWSPALFLLPSRFHWQQAGADGGNFLPGGAITGVVWSDLLLFSPIRSLILGMMLPQVSCGRGWTCPPAESQCPTPLFPLLTSPRSNKTKFIAV